MTYIEIMKYAEIVVHCLGCIEYIAHNIPILHI